MPLLSIILPVYNGASFLQRAIDSVLSQSLQSWELILVNDGSTDETDDICREYSIKEKRIHYICQDNRGLSAARNTGFSYASGDYIAYLDADDFVSSSYYQCLIHELEQSSADLIISGFIREFHRKSGRQYITAVRWTQKYISIPKQINRESQTLEFYHAYIHVWNKLYRRNFLLKNHVTFDESLRYGEDVPYNICVLSHAASILFSENTGYHYVCHSSTQLTTRWNDTLIESNADIYRRIKQHELNIWHISESYIASGMYLRGCFLFIEKAINFKVPLSNIYRHIKTIINMPETKYSIAALSYHCPSIEFYLYCLILRTRNTNIIYIAALMRRGIKIMLGR